MAARQPPGKPSGHSHSLLLSPSFQFCPHLSHFPFFPLSSFFNLSHVFSLLFSSFFLLYLFLSVPLSILYIPHRKYWRQTIWSLALSPSFFHLSFLRIPFFILSHFLLSSIFLSLLFLLYFFLVFPISVLFIPYQNCWRQTLWSLALSHSFLFLSLSQFSLFTSFCLASFSPTSFSLSLSIPH